MVLEKIVKFAKVASTNRLVPATYALAGTGAGLALVDGRISSMDIASLLMTGTIAAIGTASSVIEQKIYRDVERICENYGFTEDVMRNKSLRRKAKIYAADSGRMDEFTLALKQY
ncbi:MAG: hypothetical protein GF364_01685 [Candidatus Lokiarchaeota archaeon]|nr:hypothetical protein [Candidatus Lokiarchaeota archaeon]